MTLSDCKKDASFALACPTLCGRCEVALCGGEPDPSECGSTYLVDDCKLQNIIGQKVKSTCPAMCGTCVTTTTNTATTTTKTNKQTHPTYSATVTTAATTNTIYTPQACQGVLEAAGCGTRIPIDDCNLGGIHQQFAAVHCPVMCRLECTSTTTMSSTTATTITTAPSRDSKHSDNDAGKMAGVRENATAKAGGGIPRVTATTTGQQEGDAMATTTAATTPTYTADSTTASTNTIPLIVVSVLLLAVVCFIIFYFCFKKRQDGGGGGGGGQQRQQTAHHTNPTFSLGGADNRPTVPTQPPGGGSGSGGSSGGGGVEYFAPDGSQPAKYDKLKAETTAAHTYAEVDESDPDGTGYAGLADKRNTYDGVSNA